MERSYALLRVLNKDYPEWLRRVADKVGRLWCRMCTGDPVVAGWAGSWFAAGDFKQGARVSGWCGRVWRPRWRIWSDPFFDFTEGADDEVLRHFEAILQDKRARLAEGVALGDELYVEARRGHLLLEQQTLDLARFNGWYSTFEARANRLLDAVVEPELGATDAETTNRAERHGDFKTEHAVQALQAFEQVLPLREWRWYVVSGTFLGLIREGGFLAHDYDIDLGIDGDGVDVAEIRERFMRSSVFVVKKVDAHVEVSFDPDGVPHVSMRPSLVKLVHRTGINVDLFLHYRERDVVWHGSVIHRWNNSPFGLQEYDLEGLRVLGPDAADRYLTENYGEWKTPVKEFDCTTGTPNLVVSRNFLSIGLFLKRLEHFSRHDAEQYRKLKATLLRNRIVTEEGGKLRLSDLKKVWS
ncbi:hypothetical protein [Thioalkalivibrio sp. ALE31]|uniref:hypothetical protein n=1 Tax=Thioalkalivibrio sp. ALE31 TaxID=1158182 RepID=UPI00035E851F|nr:hypothetical protein [Thioalkalivibrio sp. ALE31]